MTRENAYRGTCSWCGVELKYPRRRVQFMYEQGPSSFSTDGPSVYLCDACMGKAREIMEGDDCMSDRDYRDMCGKMLDVADELRRIAAVYDRDEGLA